MKKLRSRSAVVDLTASFVLTGHAELYLNNQHYQMTFSVVRRISICNVLRL